MPGIIVKAATFDRYMQTLAVSLLNGSDDRGGGGMGEGRHIVIRAQRIDGMHRNGLISWCRGRDRFASERSAI